MVVLLFPIPPCYHTPNALIIPGPHCAPIPKNVYSVVEVFHEEATDATSVLLTSHTMYKMIGEIGAVIKRAEVGVECPALRRLRYMYIIRSLASPHTVGQCFSSHCAQ